MPKVWTGAKVLILGGAVAAGTVAAVASGMFDSDGDREGLSPGERRGVVAEEAGGSAEIDYNCNLPGKGFPWLHHRPWETDTFVGDAPPAVFWSPLGTEIEFSMPIARDRDGGVDYAEVYETLCRVHPDLGGTEARELSEEEKRTFSDLRVYLGTGEIVPFYERGCLLTSTNWDGEVTWSRVSYHPRSNPDEFR